MTAESKGNGHTQRARLMCRKCGQIAGTIEVAINPRKPEQPRHK